MSADDPLLPPASPSASASASFSATSPPTFATRFEAADFDPPDSLVFRRARREVPTCAAIFSHWALLGLTGVLLGLFASLLTYSSRILQALKMEELAQMSAREQKGDVPPGTAYAVYALMSAGYGLLAALPTAFIAPSAAGSGIPEVKCVLNGVHMPGVISFRTLLVKVIGLIFAVSSGLPVGKEGPMIHSGAILAAVLATGRPPRWLAAFCCGACGTRAGAPLSLRDHLRHDREQRDMVVCGAAAGVAAAFGAPVGGVLFAIEEGASFWFRSLIWHSFFCAVVAAFTIEYFLSGLGVPGTSAGSWGTLGTPGMFSFGNFTSESAGWQLWELPLFLVLGALGGLVGAAFVGVNHAITQWRFRNVPALRPWHRIAEVVAIVLLCATVKFWLSRLVGRCYALPTEGPGTSGVSSFSGVRSFCADGEYNDLASLLLEPGEDAIRSLFHFTSRGNSLSVSSVAIFFVAYVTLAVIVFGICVPSGLFIPSLLSGAAMGRLMGEAINVALVHLAPHLPGGSLLQVNVGVYALLGAAACLGGITRMVISVAVIIIECTGDSQYALPLTAVLFTARFIGNLFTDGIFDMHIEQRKVPILHDSVPHKFAYALRAGDVMLTPPDVIFLHEVEVAGRVLEALERSSPLSPAPQSAFPILHRELPLDSGGVVDDGVGVSPARRGNFAGLIGRRELAFLLLRVSNSQSLGSSPPQGMRKVGSQLSHYLLPGSTAAAGLMSLQGSPMRPGGTGGAGGARVVGSGARAGGVGIGPGGVGNRMIRAPSYGSLGSMSAASDGGHECADGCDSDCDGDAELEAAPLIDWRLMHDGTPEPSLAQLRAALAGSDPSLRMDLRPYANRAPFTISPHAYLDRAFRLYRQQGLRHLVVVDGRGNVAGLISRSELVTDRLDEKLRSLLSTREQVRVAEALGLRRRL